MKIHIESLIIKQSDCLLTTLEDAGKRFYLPLRKCGRLLEAVKAAEQPFTNQVLYHLSREEIAECELSENAVIADSDTRAWRSETFLLFWHAGEAVQVDVGLQALFARQAEDFAPHFNG
ncbi:hypothetical protein [Glaesserella sp.]|uniref:hypothetical protein n=1 Tax=Glaesserella sp. TaxID=2094731 RepID=UPI0035A1BD9D